MEGKRFSAPSQRTKANETTKAICFTSAAASANRHKMPIPCIAAAAVTPVCHISGQALTLASTTGLVFSRMSHNRTAKVVLTDVIFSTDHTANSHLQRTTHSPIPAESELDADAQIPCTPFPSPLSSPRPSPRSPSPHLRPSPISQAACDSSDSEEGYLCSSELRIAVDVGSLSLDARLETTDRLIRRVHARSLRRLCKLLKTVQIRKIRCLPIRAEPSQSEKKDLRGPSR